MLSGVVGSSYDGAAAACEQLGRGMQNQTSWAHNSKREVRDYSDASFAPEFEFPVCDLPLYARLAHGKSMRALLRRCGPQLQGRDTTAAGRWSERVRTPIPTPDSDSPCATYPLRLEVLTRRYRSCSGSRVGLVLGHLCTNRPKNSRFSSEAGAGGSGWTEQTARLARVRVCRSTVHTRDSSAHVSDGCTTSDTARAPHAGAARRRMSTHLARMLYGRGVACWCLRVPRWCRHAWSVSGPSSRDAKSLSGARATV